MKETAGSARDREWMPLTEHLGELRKRLIYCLIIFIIGLV
jgi:sec-independent protein translocase protein TatC